MVIDPYVSACEHESFEHESLKLALHRLDRCHPILADVHHQQLEDVRCEIAKSNKSCSRLFSSRALFRYTKDLALFISGRAHATIINLGSMINFKTFGTSTSSKGHANDWLMIGIPG